MRRSKSENALDAVTFNVLLNSHMNKSIMNSSSKTDWARIDAMTDDEIDVSDSPLLSDDFFAKAKLLMPGESASRQTVKVELELDPKILAWFQSQGQDYERRIRVALRLYAEVHQAAA